MKYDIYGRFQLEVLPADLKASEIAVYLDDLFHELDGNNRGVREL